MSETVNQVNATEETPKTFTQEELDRVVADRIKRERAKYEGFEDFKAKAERLDEIEAANKTELEKAHEKAAKLEKELNVIKQAEAVRLIREEVAKSTGIPAHLLTGNTKEDCEAQAAAIADYAKPTPYPTVKDAGEINNIGKPSTRQQFAEWTNNVF